MKDKDKVIKEIENIKLFLKEINLFIEKQTAFNNQIINILNGDKR